jgi:SecD/SecF fusion protein
MKSFSRRIIICLALLLLSGLIVGRAGVKYARGEGGFKLGVDLVGGTILVYEVDEERRRQQELDNPNLKKFDPDEMAAFLKRRIDPADIYNVTIRPVGGGSRFEIILPTGGAREAEIERDSWQSLLADVKAKWPDVLGKMDLDVPQGRDRDLILKVQQELNWHALKVKLRDKYPVLKDKPELDAVPVGRADKLTEVVKALASPNDEELKKFISDNLTTTPPEEIEAFVNQHYGAAGGKKNVSSEEVQKIKDLIKQQGSLEFRILANQHMDGVAIKAAEEFFKNKTPERIADLERRARQGLPPEPPKPTEDAEPWKYSYSWFELGKDERRALGLNNAAKTTHPNWKKVADAREKGEAVVLLNDRVTSSDDSKRGSTTMLVWSRKCENLQLSPIERDRKEFEYFILLRNPVSPDMALTGSYLVSASVNDLTGEKAVNFTFNARGGQIFGELTRENLPKGESPNALFSFLAIILDGQVVSAPSLSSIITTSGQIKMGSADPEDLRRLAQILRSGALPATLKPDPVSENTIGATLGADTIRKGTLSIGIAFGAVLVFMLFYYRFAGMVACIALLANLLFTIAFMVFVNATFTLPGLAGLVLTLGMAVDANVLIYERLREERERGANLLMALRNGYDRALPTIIDTHLTSIFTAIVLYAVGNDQLKGFGISLCAGLIISLFTSLYMTRLMFDLWQSRGWLKKLSMYSGMSNWLHKHYFDFMSVRKIWFTITVALTVIGLAVFLFRGKSSLNIDFVGGTAYGGVLTKPLTIEELRNLLAKDKQDVSLKVERVERKDDNGFLFDVTFADGATSTVRLPKVAAGSTKAEQENDVKERASQLPDWSVEQIFFTDKENTRGGNSSRRFTIRSTEKAADLVQLAVARLLRDGPTSLLEQVTFEFVPQNRHATLAFNHPASPGYLKLLLDRAFESAGVKDNQPFELRGEGKGDEGRFVKMSLDVSSPNVDEAKLKEILSKTQADFASRPQPERLENFDAQLAADTSRRAMYAILLSWGAILLYLWFRFHNWTFGAAAVLCLVHDLCFTLGCIAGCHYLVHYVPGFASFLGIEDFKIDLPAVAALLTLVGYSVNDTIVVFDRIREVRGKSPALTEQMINDSVNQTLTRTILASMTVFLVVIVLYIWGGEGVKLFSFVMVIGVIVGTYSSIYIASPLLLIFGEGSTVTARDRKAIPQPAPV